MASTVNDDMLEAATVAPIYAGTRSDSSGDDAYCNAVEAQLRKILLSRADDTAVAVTLGVLLGVFDEKNSPYYSTAIQQFWYESW